MVNRGSTELGVSLRPIRSKFSLLRVVRLPEFAGLRPVRVVAGLRAVVLPRPPFETDELLPRICGRVVAGLWHPISVAALCSVVNLVVRGGALFGGAGILRLGTLDAIVDVSVCAAVTQESDSLSSRAHAEIVRTR